LTNTRCQTHIIATAQAPSSQCPLLRSSLLHFFFNDPTPPDIYPLSLHDALPISSGSSRWKNGSRRAATRPAPPVSAARATRAMRSEEHTSELQSLTNLVCRLLLEKKKLDERISILTERTETLLPTRMKTSPTQLP